MSEESPLRGRALPSQDAVELSSDKWRISLLHLLTPGPQGAKTLQQGVSKISPTVLTETLRGMERDGLISRKLYPRRSAPSGAPAYGDGCQRDRAPQNTLPLRGGTRPGTARIRRREEEIPLRMLSQKEMQREKRQTQKKDRWELRYDRQSHGDFISYSPPTWSRGAAAEVHTYHLARLTCLGRAA
jgi:hypothetical protein